MDNDSVYSAINRAEQELMSLPRNYTPEIARMNKDILLDHEMRTYNADRLHEFLNNVKEGIPDYVRITTFGIDGPAKISILQYLGKNMMIYTVDLTRYTSGYLANYFGDTIKIYDTQNFFSTRNYEFVTFDNIGFPIFREIIT